MADRYHASRFDPSLIAAAERAYDAYRLAWVGMPEEVIDFGDCLFRTASGLVHRLAFNPASLDARLDALLPQLAVATTIQPWQVGCVVPHWLVNPASQPDDIGTHLLAHGLAHVEQRRMYLRAGMSPPLLPREKTFQIEPLSSWNVDEYATLRARGRGAGYHAAIMETAWRFLGQEEREVSVWVARIDSAVVAYSMLRIELHGLAWLHGWEATIGGWERGVYDAILTHHLGIAHESHCDVMMVVLRPYHHRPFMRQAGDQSWWGWRSFVPVRTFDVYRQVPAEDASTSA